MHWLTQTEQGILLSFTGKGVSVSPLISRLNRLYVKNPFICYKCLLRHKNKQILMSIQININRPLRQFVRVLSWNHGAADVGKCPWRSPNLTHSPEQDQPQQVAWKHVYIAFKYFQGWDTTVSEQPVPVFHHSHIKIICFSEISCISICTGFFFLFSNYHWRRVWLHLLHSLPTSYL